MWFNAPLRQPVSSSRTAISLACASLRPLQDSLLPRTRDNPTLRKNGDQQNAAKNDNVSRRTIVYHRGTAVRVSGYAAHIKACL
jgi:hypothetical protein